MKMYENIWKLLREWIMGHQKREKTRQRKWKKKTHSSVQLAMRVCSAYCSVALFALLALRVCSAILDVVYEVVQLSQRWRSTLRSELSVSDPYRLRDYQNAFQTARLQGLIRKGLHDYQNIFNSALPSQCRFILWNAYSFLFIDSFSASQRKKSCFNTGCLHLLGIQKIYAAKYQKSTFSAHVCLDYWAARSGGSLATCAEVLSLIYF